LKTNKEDYKPIKPKVYEKEDTGHFAPLAKPKFHIIEETKGKG